MCMQTDVKQGKVGHGDVGRADDAIGNQVVNSGCAGINVVFTPPKTTTWSPSPSTPTAPCPTHRPRTPAAPMTYGQAMLFRSRELAWTQGDIRPVADCKLSRRVVCAEPTAGLPTIPCGPDLPGSGLPSPAVSHMSMRARQSIMNPPDLLSKCK